jgi:hypothetical protein
MLSVTDEQLWDLCSSPGDDSEEGGADGADGADGAEGGEKKNNGEEEAWPYFVNGWSEAIQIMNSVGRPFSPYRKMEALAEVSRIMFLRMFLMTML